MSRKVAKLKSQWQRISKPTLNTVNTSNLRLQNNTLRYIKWATKNIWPMMRVQCSNAVFKWAANISSNVSQKIGARMLCLQWTAIILCNHTVCSSVVQVVYEKKLYNKVDSHRYCWIYVMGRGDQGLRCCSIADRSNRSCSTQHSRHNNPFCLCLHRQLQNGKYGKLGADTRNTLKIQLEELLDC